MDPFNLAKKNTQLHTETLQALHKATLLSWFHIPSRAVCVGALVRAVTLQQEEGLRVQSKRALSVLDFACSHFELNGFSSLSPTTQKHECRANWKL